MNPWCENPEEEQKVIQKNRRTQYTQITELKRYQESEMFRHVHVDNVCPLPVSRGFTYLLSVIETERFSRWPEAFLLLSITDEECVQQF